MLEPPYLFPSRGRQESHWLTRNSSYVLVTGATGFIGAHVVDELLRRGLRVRGATRSLAKGDAMLRDRPQFLSSLDFVEIDGFENPGRLEAAVQDVDGVIHVASPLTYDTTNNEKELMIPAINGVKAILQASSKSNVKRIVMTSSFASVMNACRNESSFFTYTDNDWNPQTYEESAAPDTPAHIAYRGAKKFAEEAAWKFMEERKPSFDIVALCPPMTFGPIVHPVASTDQLNETNAMLWKIAEGQPLSTARVPFWIDVRDLATAHVEALLRPAAGGKRFLPASPERFSYDIAAGIMEKSFKWAKGRVKREKQSIDETYGIGSETAARELGLEYRSFQESVVDLISQISQLDPCHSDRD